MTVARLLVAPKEHAGVLKGESCAGVFLPDVVERVNRFLPPQVRVFACSTNANGLNGRDTASWRHYECVLCA